MDLNNIESYNYNLPEGFIAQYPHSPADECKLLIYRKKEKKKKTNIFKDIVDLIEPNTTIFFNNSKVIKARLPIIEWKYEYEWKIKTLKKWEIFFIENKWWNTYNTMIYPGNKLKTWTIIHLDNKNKIKIKDISEEWRIVEIQWDKFEKILENYWQMPLPPYIKYSKEKEKPYQPIFAKEPWSTASPTASLHFTSKLLEELKNKWINQEYTTLHVGLWTFKIVNVSNIQDYDIHTEITEIDKNIWWKIFEANKKWNILATWTTVTRTLESLPYLYKKISKQLNIDNDIKRFWESKTENITNKEYEKFIKKIEIKWDKIQFETKLFIYPWFKFKIIDELITNFHLPKSSLLMLVAWFMWHKNMFDCYDFAIKNNYRFFSFGDAMYIK